MANVSLKCSCGAVRGDASGIGSGWGRRVVCMCDDCQAFAHYLKRGQDILDANGGTDIFQLTPSQVHIRHGHEHLACVKLSPKGLLRWYTSCCHTPVGNTLASVQSPFAGIPHVFMDHEADGQTRDEALGPVAYRLYAQFGRGVLPDRAHQKAPIGLLLSTLGTMVAERIKGHHLPSPFFRATGEPVSEPVVLEASERAALGLQ